MSCFSRGRTPSPQAAPGHHRLPQGAKAGRDGAPGTREHGQSSLLGYFAAAAMQTSEPKAPSISKAEEDVISTLTQLNLDEMSPREAFALIERLKIRLGDE